MVWCYLMVGKESDWAVCTRSLSGERVPPELWIYSGVEKYSVGRSSPPHLRFDLRRRVCKGQEKDFNIERSRKCTAVQFFLDAWDTEQLPAVWWTFQDRNEYKRSSKCNSALVAWTAWAIQLFALVCHHNCLLGVLGVSGKRCHKWVILQKEKSSSFKLEPNLLFP